LAGSQMTLLPLILTNQMSMTASAVGQVYMGMSCVQVLTNPFMAKYVVDRIGKAPAIAGGCAVIATSMTCLPLVISITTEQQWPLFVGTLAFWALGSSMLSTAPLAYISDQVPEHQRAQAIAMLRTGGDVGFLLGASCIGGIADVTGSLDLAMQSSGGLLSAATFWFVVRQTLLSTRTTSDDNHNNNNHHHHHHHLDSTTKGDKDRHDDKSK
jgi:MFS family permease